MIRAVVFDLGGVVTIGDPLTGMLSYCAHAIGVTEERLLEPFSRIHDAWKKGQFPEKEFWEKITSPLHVSMPQGSSLWLDSFLSMYRENKDILSLIMQLKQKRFAIGLLSNTEVPVANFIKNKHGELFDIFVCSCNVGMIKPDAEIYQLTLQKLHMKPEEVVFVDDKEENVLGARDIGIHGIHFTDTSSLIHDLKQLSVEV